MAKAKKIPRCTAEVAKRDTYRLKRGKGFTLRYNYEQCNFKAVIDGRCLRHPKAKGFTDYYGDIKEYKN